MNGNADDKLFFYMKNQFIRHGFISLGDITLSTKSNFQVNRIRLWLKERNINAINASLSNNILSINNTEDYDTKKTDTCNKLDKYIICKNNENGWNKNSGFVTLLLNNKKKLVLPERTISLLLLNKKAVAFTSVGGELTSVASSGRGVYEINVKGKKPYLRKIIDWDIAITQAIVLNEEKGEFLFVTFKGELVKLIYRANAKSYSQKLMSVKGWYRNFPNSMIKLSDSIVLLTTYRGITLIDLDRNITEAMIPNESVVARRRVKFQIALPDQK
ncbi:hypothetical protein [Thiofilum flexile]|uniref:hypothetical protein n=1 Tax=Thiofilum flexile TaxID=125627 RepID=UPI0013A56051|nr:hypothetical protein [Thiofilum flexile]